MQTTTENRLRRLCVGLRLCKRIKDRAARRPLFKKVKIESIIIAEMVFELTQSIETKWLEGDYRAKRQILDLAGLNYTLEGTSLCFETTRPFDVLAEWLYLENGRLSRTAVELFLQGLSKKVRF